MRTISIQLRDLPKIQLKIGYEGEQNHTRVIIDCKEIFDDYPNAAATMVAQPPVGDLYPVILTRDGDRVIWNVARGDVANEGSGSLQLTFTDGSGDAAEIIKTEYGSYYAKASLTATGDAPASIDDWLEDAQQTLSDLEAFDNMTATATTLETGESATAEMRKVLGHKDILIGIPKGEKGDTGAAGADGKDGSDGADGYSPTASVSKSGSTATITITDKNGTTTAQISDGAGADVIDDTAGTGDTTVTWSADKLTSEKSDVMSAISGKASKTDTVIDTTLSRGRKANTTVGVASFAFGNDVEASGYYSQAEGNGTSTETNNSHVFGKYNVPNDKFPVWNSNTHYYVGDKVRREIRFQSSVTYTPFECIEENTDSSWTSSHWQALSDETIDGEYVEVVGNGANGGNRSNARTLDWDGNEELAGDLTVFKGSNNETSVGSLVNAISKDENALESARYPMVDSVDEMIDGTKKYVLKSNFHIYESEGQQGDPPNEFEVWQLNYRLVTSSPYYSSANGYLTTSMIKIDRTADANATIRIKNAANLPTRYGTGSTWGSCRYEFFDSSKAYISINYMTGYNGSGSYWHFTADGNDITASFASIPNGIPANAEYIAFCFVTVDTSSSQVADNALSAISQEDVNAKNYGIYISTHSSTVYSFVDTGVTYSAGKMIDDHEKRISIIANADDVLQNSKPLGFATATGEDVTSTTSYWNSGLVEVPTGSTLSSNVEIYKTAFFNENRIFISCNNTAHSNITIPQNTRYIKIQIANSVVSYANKNTVKIYIDGNQVIHVANTVLGENSVKFEKMSRSVQNALGCTDDGFPYEGERIRILSNRFSFTNLCPGYGGQGGCVYGDKLFQFNAQNTFKVINIKEGTVYANGTLSGTIIPHSNSVTLGEKYDSSDPYPLVYINAYNATDLPKGTCYVYRLSETTSGSTVTITGTIIQTITIGFVEDSIWKSSDSDTRPYGNFCVDTENGYLYVYTLRDADQHTRFFKFSLPSTSSSTVTLQTTDIIDYFDTNYFTIIQDNTYHDGKLYICSGYGTSENKGYIRVVDLAQKKEVSRVCLTDAGLTFEPEVIDIYNDRLICGDAAIYQFLF